MLEQGPDRQRAPGHPDRRGVHPSLGPPKPISEQIGRPTEDGARVCCAIDIGLSPGATALHEGVFTVGVVLWPPLHRASWPLAHGFHRKGIARESGRSGTPCTGAWLRQHHLTRQSVPLPRWAPFAKPSPGGKRPQAAEVGARRAGHDPGPCGPSTGKIGLLDSPHSPRSTPDSSLPEVDFFLPFLLADRGCHRRFPDPNSLDRDPLGLRWFQIRQAARPPNKNSSGRPAPSTTHAARLAGP